MTVDRNFLKAYRCSGVPSSQTLCRYILCRKTHVVQSFFFHSVLRYFILGLGHFITNCNSKQETVYPSLPCPFLETDDDFLPSFDFLDFRPFLSPLHFGPFDPENRAFFDDYSLCSLNSPNSLCSIT